MHRERGFVRKQDDASPVERLGFLLLELLLPVLMYSRAAAAAPAKVSTPAAKNQSAASAPGDFVGQETCATCHEEAVKGFASNPHTKLAEMHGMNGVTCESCHGAGKALVDGNNNKTKNNKPTKTTTKEID